MKTLTTLRSVPPFVVGHVRDLRVRWALEEANMPYKIRLVDDDDRVSPAYRRQQPFGQVPVLQDGEVTLFESGAILMYLGEQSPVLLPRDAQGRLETTMWMFAALNTVEPAIGSYADLLFFSGQAAGDAERRGPLEAEASQRLQQLDTWLAGRDYLTSRFTVADILMTTVLHLLAETDLVARFPSLSAYHARCKERAAFKKAFADQVALYAGEEVPA